MALRMRVPIPVQRGLAAGLLVLAGLALATWPRSTVRPDYVLGEVAPATVVAEIDFPVLRDPDALAEERRDRASSVPVVLTRVDSASVQAYERLAFLRDQVRKLRLREGDERAAGAEEGELVLAFSQSALIALLLGDRYDEILDQADLLLQDVMQRGYVSGELRERLTDYGSVRIQDPLGAVTKPVDQLFTADRVRELARARAVSRGLPHEAVAEVVLYCSIPNLVVDDTGTDSLVQEAVELVTPHSRIVRKGETIVSAREVITAERLRVIESHEYWKGERTSRAGWLERFSPVLGDCLLVLVLAGVFFTFLWIHRRSLLDRPSDFWLLWTIEMVVFFLTWLLVVYLHLPHVVVPVSAAAILVALHFDVRLAVATSLFPTFLIGLVAGGGATFLAVIGIGVVVSVLIAPSLRQRRHFYRVLAVVAGVHLTTLLGLSLADGGSIEVFQKQALAAVANPFLATAVVLIFLPVSESVFRRCTDLSLYELVDLNRPLLRRLMLEAPGTYHHSLMVGALAESAALSVGANGLLARVIGYYHDVGKLTKPELFEENAGAEEHVELAPSMRRVVLESHVREGGRLAEREGLPREIRDGIREHHGMSEMPPSVVDPADPVASYRFPGPIPTSPESALVLLANEVDAAARRLGDPSPSRIQALVTEVVQRNVASGNLDASGLRVDDLAAIRKTFVTMLSAGFRGRGARERQGDESDGKTGPDQPALSEG